MTIDKHLSWGLVLIAIGWVAIAMLVNGCGSNIPIGEPPTCVEQVTDECVPEVVAEFCPEAESCDECATCTDDCVLAGELCWRGMYLNGAWTYVQVACDIQPNPVCEEPEECPPSPSFEAICKRLPYGIRKKQPECKHYCDHHDRHSVAPKCDKNCDPDDPICIPCKLEVATRTCRTTCRTTPLQQQECITICTGTDEVV